jgi:hypothetical protein
MELTKRGESSYNTTCPSLSTCWRDLQIHCSNVPQSRAKSWQNGQKEKKRGDVPIIKDEQRTNNIVACCHVHIDPSPTASTTMTLSTTTRSTAVVSNINIKNNNKLQWRSLLFSMMLLLVVLFLACTTTTMAFVPTLQFSATGGGPPFHQAAPRRILVTGREKNTLNSLHEEAAFSPCLTCLEMQKKKGSSSGKSSSSPGGGAAAAATTNKGFASGGAPTKRSFPYAGTIRPGRQSAQKTVTIPSIVKPDYWKTGIPGSTSSNSGGASILASSRPPFQLPWMIEVKSASDIEKMRAAGSLARDILDLAGRHVQQGVTTDEIDELVHEAIIAASAIVVLLCFVVLCCFCFLFFFCNTDL